MGVLLILIMIMILASMLRNGGCAQDVGASIIVVGTRIIMVSMIVIMLIMFIDTVVMIMIWLTTILYIYFYKQWALEEAITGDMIINQLLAPATSQAYRICYCFGYCYCF